MVNVTFKPPYNPDNNVTLVQPILRLVGRPKLVLRAMARRPHGKEDDVTLTIHTHLSHVALSKMLDTVA